MKIKICLDVRRARKDESYPIVVDIWNVNRVRVSTGYTAIKSNWDIDLCLYNKKESNYLRKNLFLKNIYNQVERLSIELKEERKVITDKALREAVVSIISPDDKLKNKEKYFIDYLDEFISSKINEGTKTNYRTTRNKLLEYDSKCTFESMDKKWLSNFEMWMANSMKVNAYAIHFRNIRAVFNYCIDEGYTTLYPFRKFQIKREETRKRCLTIEQLRILRDYPCESYQERYRDMFMLMFYMIGINASDLFLAKKSDVINGRLEYKRHKTSKLYSIKIEPEAMEIINKYAGKGEYLLDIMDGYGNYKDFLHRMGVALKQIGDTERKGLGGKKIRTPLFPDLSSYWSRHTWATLAAGLDIPMETISRALGHSIGSEVTSIYIKFDYKKVDDANRKVIDLLESKIKK